MTKNQVMLYKLLVNFPDDSQDNLAQTMSVQRNLMKFGYMLDQNAFDQLRVTDAANIKDFYNECDEMLKDMLGGKLSYTSLYNNFPNDILSLTDSQLWYNQVSHYWGKKKFKKEGLPKDSAFEYVTYKIIKGSTPDAILDVYRILAGSGQSLAPLDTKVLKYFATAGIELPVVPVPFKENLAILAGILPGFKVQTVIDVLRIAVGFSGGDVSLPAVPKSLKKKGSKWDAREKEREAFKFKLSKDKKLIVMRLFENSNLSLSDMKQGSKYGRFVRLSEVLKVQNFSTEFPLTFAAFQRLKNQKRKGKPKGTPVIRTWHSQVEQQFKLSFLDGLNKLSERPGELFRRIDYLIRLSVGNQKQMDQVLLKLSQVGAESSNKVLFEVFTHFESRGVKADKRTVFIKGARTPVELPILKPLSKQVIESIQNTILNTIKYKFSTLDKLGNVYIDPELKKIPLPTNMRTLSESLTPLIRGQRTPIPEGLVLRSFVHWNDVHGNEDLDLHGYLISDSKSVSFGYNGIYSASMGTYSGDVMNRKGPCAEYVDIKLKEATDAGFKYYIPMVNNFRNRGFDTMKDVVCGHMMRDFPESNDAWVPDTITNAMKLSSKSTRTLLGVFDLLSKEYIHLDLDFDNFATYINGGNSKEFLKQISKYVDLPKLSVYDLLEWHVETRGIKSSKETADTHLLFNDFKSDYTAILPWMGV